MRWFVNVDIKDAFDACLEQEMPRVEAQKTVLQKFRAECDGETFKTILSDVWENIDEYYPKTTRTDNPLAGDVACGEPDRYAEYEKNIEFSLDIMSRCGIADMLACFPPDDRGVLRAEYRRIAGLIRNNIPLVSFRQVFYVWDGRRYVRDTGRIAGAIQTVIRVAEWRGKVTDIKREVLSILRDTAVYTKYPFGVPHGTIPVANGVLRLAADGSVTFDDHSPSNLFNWYLPVFYDPDAPTAAIADALDAWYDDRSVLLRPLAQAVTQAWGMVWKNTFMIEGEPDTGKTTYCDVLYKFLGIENFSKIPLQKICGDKFALSGLVGKLANIQDETREIPVRNIGIFKDLVGGEHQDVEAKNEQAYNTVLHAVHLFTANRPPKLDETDDEAWWSRWTYIIFPNKFARNPGFKTGLLTDENMSGLLLLVLGEIFRIMREGMPAPDADGVRDLWLCASDAVHEFYRINFDHDPEGRIPKDSVYMAYIQYCRRTGTAAKAKNVFSGTLSRYGVVGVRSQTKGVREQDYQGIRWKENGPDAPLSIGQGGQGISQFDTRTIPAGQGGQGGQGIFGVDAE